jgi:hypothetical protein
MRAVQKGGSRFMQQQRLTYLATGLLSYVAVTILERLAEELEGQILRTEIYSIHGFSHVFFGIGLASAVLFEACYSRSSGCGDSVGTVRGLMVGRGTFGLPGRRDAVSPFRVSSMLRWECEHRRRPELDTKQHPSDQFPPRHGFACSSRRRCL